MNEVLKEISIRVIAAVITVLILALLLELLRKQQGPCGCQQRPNNQPNGGNPIPNANDSVPEVNIKNLLNGFDLTY